MHSFYFLNAYFSPESMQLLSIPNRFANLKIFIKISKVIKINIIIIIFTKTILKNFFLNI